MKSCYARFSAKRYEILVRKGFTDQECADFFDVSISVITSWKNKHPEFKTTLKAWKESADYLVEKSLYERATGITYEEITKEPKKSLEGEMGDLVVTKVVTKFSPPDVVAQIFWLKNRQPDVWRDKKEVDVNVNLSESLKEARSRLIEYENN